MNNKEKKKFFKDKAKKEFKEKSGISLINSKDFIEIDKEYRSKLIKAANKEIFQDPLILSLIKVNRIRRGQIELLKDEIKYLETELKKWKNNN